MIRTLLRTTLSTTLLMLLAALVSACGTAATPVWQTPEATATRLGGTPIAAAVGNDEAAEPSATPLPPTTTPEPATATPEPPTATPAPTEAPTEAAPAASGGGDDEIAFLVSIADPTDGEVLFNQMLTFSDGLVWACATCHSISSDGVQAGLGPNQWGLRDRAPEYMPAQYPSVESYIYNSIVNPNEYIREGFTENVMPQEYHTLLTDEQILNIVAYLMTLG